LIDQLVHDAQNMKVEMEECILIHAV
jgi:hypothetical protein